jgi:hypothetical protein
LIKTEESLFVSIEITKSIALVRVCIDIVGVLLQALIITEESLFVPLEITKSIALVIVATKNKINEAG